MRRAAAAVAIATILALSAACTAPPPAPPAPPSSGLDLGGFDRSVRPQDDLFRFANGRWLADTQIPADRKGFGAFELLADQTELDIRAIAEGLGAAPTEPGSEPQKIADLYASFMDTATVDRLGVTPLAPELARIDSIADTAGLVGYLGYQAANGLSGPVSSYVDQDARDATVYAFHVDQAGLSLPDRDYYLSETEPFTTIRTRFRDYVTQMLTLAGVPDADTAGPRVLELETRLARAQLPKTALRDPIARYNKFAVPDAPGPDWVTYLRAAGVDVGELIIGQPAFMTALGAELADVPLADWKSYLRFHLVDGFAPQLSTPFVDAGFDFRGKLLQGREQQRPRWKRAVASVNSSLGEAVGRRYVEQHFSAESKQRMDALVADLVLAFGRSIDELDWMGQGTKAEARTKLSLLTTKIGFPATWKDYSALEIRRDDLIGNVMRSAKVEYTRDLAKLGKPVDRGEWFMTPQTVNAYYNASLNEIVFPAAILQPPFFNAAADDAVNYGAIGAVIGHEISHAFDDQGRKFDGTGNLRDWWTAEDAAKFTERTAGLTQQFNAYEPVPGTKINGELTLGENIADLAGLAVAHEAYRISLQGRPAAENPTGGSDGRSPEQPGASTGPDTIDGFTGDQRFFLGYAQVWRGKQREEAMRELLLSDTHSPEEYRVNGIVGNVAGFYQAFGVGPGDARFRPADQRITLW